MTSTPSRAADSLPDTNPFATRCVRPGAVPFRFPPGVDASQLVARLSQLGWRGAIVGPHGSGKTTLLAALQAPLRRAGRRPLLYRLGGGRPQPRWPNPETAGWDRRTLVVVDGYEQLAPPRRWRLHRCCRRAGAGLLATAHRPVRLPLLYATRPSLETAQQIVENLLPNHRRFIHPRDVAICFRRSRGDLREMLFDLYDLWEDRRRA